MKKKYKILLSILTVLLLFFLVIDKGKYDSSKTTGKIFAPVL